MNVVTIKDAITKNPDYSTVVENLNEYDLRKLDFCVTARNNNFCMTPEGFIQVDNKLYSGTEHALKQLATKIGMPQNYIIKCLNENPVMASSHVNHWLRKKNQRFMIRTIDDNIRAIASDKYKPIDNSEIAKRIFPLLKDSGLNIESSAITETNFFMKLTKPELKAEIEGSRQVGDIVSGGLMLSNSEVGNGALSFAFYLHRLICTNGMISTSKEFAVTRKHICSRQLDEGLNYLEIPYTNFNDSVYWNQAENLIEKVIQTDNFVKVVEDLNELTKRNLKNADTRLKEKDYSLVLERFKKANSLTEDETIGIQTHLEDSEDFTQYGLLNAVTRQAQDVDNYSRQVHLERLGDKVSTMNESKFNDLIRNAA